MIRVVVHFHMRELNWLAKDCCETKRNSDFHSRLDSKARMQLVYKWVDMDMLPADDTDTMLKCCDVSVNGVVDTNDDDMLAMLKSSRPMCTGSGVVDFAAFGEGLYSDGKTTCASCLESVGEVGVEVALLPCGHSLHPFCAKKLELALAADPTVPRTLITGDVAEEAGIVCPQCQTLVTGNVDNNLAHHSMSSERRLQNRFLEFIRTGFCWVCQIKYIEQSQFTSQIVRMPDNTPVISFVAEHTRCNFGMRIPTTAEVQT